MCCGRKDQPVVYPDLQLSVKSTHIIPTYRKQILTKKEYCSKCKELMTLIQVKNSYRWSCFKCK